MTRKELYDACCEHKYIAVRSSNNIPLGINSKIAIRGMHNKGHEVDNVNTRVVSFSPITFQEYISIKIGVQ